MVTPLGGRGGRLFNIGSVDAEGRSGGGKYWQLLAHCV